jgi:glycosyltransferase involved in cell wall biosynthesis
MKGVDGPSGTPLLPVPARLEEPAPASAPVRLDEPAHQIGPRQTRSQLALLAEGAALSRIDIVAWRDLDHPEAGGSEVHAARLAERWAEAGIDVQLTASAAPGATRHSRRDGYEVVRPAGRYLVFPAAPGSARAPGGRRARDAGDGVVEIWNGMPFFSPLWAWNRPRVAFVHHVHGAMWDQVLPGGLARAGKVIERRLAPPFYRSTAVVTLSESSRRAILAELGLASEQVTVVPPGVDADFCPGGRRDSAPFVVAVGRLVPYKRFDLLIDMLARLRDRHPDLRAVIAGEGTERRLLEEKIGALGATSWLQLAGRVSDAELVDLYRRAWAVCSTSAFEGWGMTITEAAACGTPAVATPIDGHVDALADGVSGILAEPGAAMEDALDAVLSNQVLRRRLSRGALARAGDLNWDQTALGALSPLAADARRRRAGAPQAWPLRPRRRSGWPSPRSATGLSGRPR